MFFRKKVFIESWWEQRCRLSAELHTLFLAWCKFDFRTPEAHEIASRMDTVRSKLHSVAEKLGISDASAEIPAYRDRYGVYPPVPGWVRNQPNRS